MKKLLRNICIGGGSKKYTSLILALLFIFTSCENFFQADNFLTELEDAIKYSNASYANITIDCEPRDAIDILIPSVGTVYTDNYKIGDSFKLSFLEKKDYKFIKWSATPEGSVTFENAEEHDTVATVCSTDSPIIIVPVCYTKKTITIQFETEYGQISPSQTMYVHPGDSIEFSYKENDQDYAFSKWVFKDSSGQIYAKCPFDNISNENDFEKKAIVGNFEEDAIIRVVAETCARPMIMDKTPVNDEIGVPRGRRITVSFDVNMDESSIYYSEEELKQKKVINAEETIESVFEAGSSASGYKLLCTEINSEKKCYGYQIIDKDDSIVFKNISITEDTIEKRNFLKYYENPHFDQDKPYVLIINTQPLLENSPPPFSKMIVTINKDFCVEGNTNITLGRSTKFTYKVNEINDNLPPETTGVTFQYNQNTGFVTNSYKTAFTKEKCLKDSNKSITISGAVEDSSSNISLIKGEYKRFVTNMYPEKNTDQTYVLEINSTQNGTDKKKMNVSGTIPLTNLSQGVYEIIITAMDEYGNSREDKRYFFVDSKKPEKPTLKTIVQSKYKDKKLTLDYSLSETDIEGVEFRFRETGKSDYKYIKSDESGFTTTESDNKIYPLSNTLSASQEIPICYRNGKQYTFEMRSIDFVGKKSDWATVNTQEYINSDGHFVYAGKEIPCTKLVDVYKTETQVHTIKEGFNLDKNVDYAGDLAKCKHNNAETITIKPYQIGGYEISEGIYKTINDNNGNVNTSKGSQAALSFYVALAFCNKLSVIYGFEPCYYLGTVSTQGNWETQKNAEDWCMNISSAASIIKNYDIKCDFTKNGYRLPRTLEFEIAARGGDETKENWHYIYSGTGSTTKRRQDAGDGRYTIDNGSTGNVLGGGSDNEKHYYNVDAGNGNLLGIHGMSGNRWEWCWDLYGEDNFLGAKKTNKLNGTLTGKNESVSIVSKNDYNSARSIKGGYSWSTDESYDWANFYPFTVRSSVPIPASGAPINNKDFRLCRTLGKDDSTE